MLSSRLVRREAGGDSFLAVRIEVVMVHQPILRGSSSADASTADPTVNYCALMPAALMIGHHFSISALVKAPSASGV